jgi:hypothetical protein
MIRALLHARLRKFEVAFGYDASYLHDVVDASIPALFKFLSFGRMSQHCEGVPKEAWFAAKIAATLSEDCGPCTQLLVDQAIRSGVEPRALSSLLRGEIVERDSDAAFGFRYGRAVARNAPDCVVLSEEAKRRYGERGVVALAFGVATARVYPALKRGLAHGAVCRSIRIDRETVVVRSSA